jgi:hypothetical protein
MDLKVQYTTIILFKLCVQRFAGLQTSIMCHCRLPTIALTQYRRIMRTAYLMPVWLTLPTSQNTGKPGLLCSHQNYCGNYADWFTANIYSGSLCGTAVLHIAVTRHQFAVGDQYQLLHAIAQTITCACLSPVPVWLTLPDGEIKTYW